MGDRSDPTAWSELTRHWPVLLGATLGVAFGASALPFYTAGLFLGQFEREFGWTRTQLTGLGLITTVMMAALSPIAGGLMDRFGVRAFAAASFAALAGAFVGISLLGGSLVVYTLITCAQTLFAPGSSPIAFTRPINAVFDRMRGLALGVTIGGIGASAAFAPPIVADLIEHHGWRAAYRALALGIVFAAPISLMLIGARRSAATPAQGRRDRRPAPIPLRSPWFWRLVAAFILIALGVAGFVTHFVPMLTDAGLPIAKAARVAGLLGVAVLGGRLGVGFLMDRAFAPYVAAGLLMLAAGGLALLAVNGVAFAVTGALAVGLVMGAEVDLIAYLTARYYGMADYGRMYGIFYGAFVLGTGASPYAISLIQAAARSYAPALWASAALLVAAGAIFVTAPRFPAAVLQDA